LIGIKSFLNEDFIFFKDFLTACYCKLGMTRIFKFLHKARSNMKKVLIDRVDAVLLKSKALKVFFEYLKIHFFLNIQDRGAF